MKKLTKEEVFIKDKQVGAIPNKKCLTKILLSFQHNIKKRTMTMKSWQKEKIKHQRNTNCVL